MSTTIACPPWCIVDHHDEPGGFHAGRDLLPNGPAVRLFQADSPGALPGVVVAGQWLSDAQAHELGIEADRRGRGRSAGAAGGSKRTDRLRSTEPPTLELAGWAVRSMSGWAHERVGGLGRADRCAGPTHAPPQGVGHPAIPDLRTTPDRVRATRYSTQEEAERVADLAAEGVDKVRGREAAGAWWAADERRGRLIGRRRASAHPVRSCVGSIEKLCRRKRPSSHDTVHTPGPVVLSLWEYLIRYACLAGSEGTSTRSTVWDWSSISK
jgi:hypothetical protein